GHPGIAGPPAGDGRVECLEGLLERGVRVVGVDVPHVDVLGAQAGQRGVQGGEQVPARAVEAPVRVPDAARLRGDHEVPARHQPRGPGPLRATGGPVRPGCLCALAAEFTGRGRPCGGLWTTMSVRAGGPATGPRTGAGGLLGAAPPDRRRYRVGGQATLLIGKGRGSCSSGSTSVTGAPEWTRTISPWRRRRTASATRDRKGVG